MADSDVQIENELDFVEYESDDALEAADSTVNCLNGNRNEEELRLKENYVYKLIEDHNKRLKQIKTRASSLLYEQPPKGDYAKKNKCPPKKNTFMTTEELDGIVKKKVTKDAIKQKSQLKRNKLVCNVLNNLERQIKESAMKDLVNKFANYLANKCVKTRLPIIMPAKYERMTRGLVANIFLSLGVNNCIKNTIDYNVYETIAYVLVNMIIEANFQHQILPGPDPNLQHWEQYQRDYLEDSTNLNECMKKRAIQVANRKFYKQKAKSYN